MEFLEQHSATQDFSVLEALEARHLAAKQDGGTDQSLQGSRLPVWRGQGIPRPAAPPKASASDNALGLHAHLCQSQVPANARGMRQSHSGPSQLAASGLSERCKAADVSWQLHRPLCGQHQQGTGHAMGIPSSSSHNPDVQPTRPFQMNCSGSETLAGSGSGTTGQHGSSDRLAGIVTAAQQQSGHSRPWQQPSREQRSPVRTAWEPGGAVSHNKYLPSYQQTAQQPRLAKVLPPKVPACTAASAALAQYADPPAAAGNLFAGQPSCNDPELPISSSGWDDWQLHAGNEFWGQDEELQPAQWEEAPEECPDSLTQPGEGRLNNESSEPYPDDSCGAEEAAVAAAADETPRLVQYKTTNKGVLVDRCVQTPPSEHSYPLDAWFTCPWGQVTVDR